MRVYSRRIGESLHIGDDITVEVRRIAGNRVTLLIETPRGAKVMRGDVPERAVKYLLNGATEEKFQDPVPCSPSLEPFGGPALP